MSKKKTGPSSYLANNTNSRSNKLNEDLNNGDFNQLYHQNQQASRGGHTKNNRSINNSNFHHQNNSVMNKGTTPNNQYAPI